MHGRKGKVHAQPASCAMAHQHHLPVPQLHRWVCVQPPESMPHASTAAARATKGSSCARGHSHTHTHYHYPLSHIHTWPASGCSAAAAPRWHPPLLASASAIASSLSPCSGHAHPPQRQPRLPASMHAPRCRGLQIRRQPSCLHDAHAVTETGFQNSVCKGDDDTPTRAILGPCMHAGKACVALRPSSPPAPCPRRRRRLCRCLCRCLPCHAMVVIRRMDHAGLAGQTHTSCGAGRPSPHMVGRNEEACSNGRARARARP